MRKKITFEKSHPLKLKALEMHYNERLTCSEICRKLNLSDTTVRTWLKRAKSEGIQVVLQPKVKTRFVAKVDPFALRSAISEMHKGAKHFGFPDDIWTELRAREHIEKQLGVQYSIGYLRKVLIKNGLRATGYTLGKSHIKYALKVIKNKNARELGFPTSTWSCEYIQQLIFDKYGVMYTKHHVSRLIRESNNSLKEINKQYR